MSTNVRSWEIPEQLKYFAARFAYRNRNELCPNPVEIKRKRVQITWQQWWEDRYGERLDSYIQTIRDQAAQANQDCGRQEAVQPVPATEASGSIRGSSVHQDGTAELVS